MSKKAAIIIAQKDFQDKEFSDTKKVLEERNIDISVVSETRDKAFGKHGAKIKPDLSIREINVNQFDALVFIGGDGAHNYFENDIIFNLIKEFQLQSKVIGAICIAPSILANAGALIGRVATSFPTEEDNLRNKGADYTGMQVEVDGNIVTGKDATAGLEFGDRIAFLLEG